MDDWFKRETGETVFKVWQGLGRSRFAVVVGMVALGAVGSGTGRTVPVVVTTAERAELAHDEFLVSRRERLAVEFDPYTGPPVARVVEEAPPPWEVKSYPWHYQIRATVFWVGEKATPRNPVSNIASAWDPHWQSTFGGYDHPFKRSGYRPAAFQPLDNPFYIALPYNDLDKSGLHRPEASEVIPWFWREYRGPSISLCEDRWVAIHHDGRVCYAQWKDVGPFTVDDYPYVFEGERPRPNRNGDAGIDVSPAVRDFLDLRGNALVDWRFADAYEVPDGPWSTWLDPLATGSGP